MATATEIATAVTTALTQATVNSVSLKLPQFWPLDPTLWFTQIEKQFDTKRITSSVTKFNHVVAVLEPEIATKVRNAILNPDSTDPYTSLKNAMLDKCRPSREQRMRQALQTDVLGDRKPSELLADLERTLDGINAGELLLSLFLERLPPQIKFHLIATGKTDVNELAGLADNLSECVQNDGVNYVSVTDVSSTPSSGTNTTITSSDISAIHEEIAALRREFTTNKPKVSTSPTTRLCWYHKRFGDKATKCVSPCSFEK